MVAHSHRNFLTAWRYSGQEIHFLLISELAFAAFALLTASCSMARNCWITSIRASCFPGAGGKPVSDLAALKWPLNRNLASLLNVARNISSDFGQHVLSERSQWRKWNATSAPVASSLGTNTCNWGTNSLPLICFAHPKAARMLPMCFFHVAALKIGSRCWKETSDMELWKVLSSLLKLSGMSLGFNL